MPDLIAFVACQRGQVPLKIDWQNQPQPLGNGKGSDTYNKLKKRVNGTDDKGNALANHTEIFF